MMKAADSRVYPDRAGEIRASFGSASAGRLVQPEMRSVFVVIVEILEAEAHQMSLV